MSVPGGSLDPNRDDDRDRLTFMYPCLRKTEPSAILADERTGRHDKDGRHYDTQDHTSG